MGAQVPLLSNHFHLMWRYFELLLPFVLACALQVVLVNFLTPHVLSCFPFVYDWGKHQLLFAGHFGMTIGGFWLPGGLLTLPSLFNLKQFKIQPAMRTTWARFFEVMPLVFFNINLGGAVATLVMVFALPASSIDLRLTPSVWVTCRDTCVFVVTSELWFFYAHRYIHINKRWYRAIHKKHHTTTAPFAYSAVHCHPVEQICVNALSLLIGPVLCQTSAVQLAAWMLSALMHTCLVHSGYWICDDKGMHDEHHRAFDVNYGVHGWMDKLYGTYQLPGTKISQA